MRKTKAQENEPAQAVDEASGPVGTLARGLSVLDVVVESPQPMTLAEIAAQTGLDQSTTLRLLRSLEESSYILRSAGSKRYLPSPRAIRPVPLMHPLEIFRRDTASVLSDLADRLNQTVVLALFLGTERMVVDIAQRPGSLSPYYGTWLKGPLHATGVGKALLVTLDPAGRAVLLGPEPFSVYTPHTITDADRLDADLKRSKTRGYIVSKDEYRMGLTAISALISSWNGQAIGCLTVTGHSDELDGEKLIATADSVVRSAQLILYKASSLRLLEQFCGSPNGLGAGATG